MRQCCCWIVALCARAARVLMPCTEGLLAAALTDNAALGIRRGR
jgi:hypothetical protein